MSRCGRIEAGGPARARTSAARACVRRLMCAVAKRRKQHLNLQFLALMETANPVTNGGLFARVAACRFAPLELMYPSSVAGSILPDSGDSYDAHFGRRRPPDRKGGVEEPPVRIQGVPGRRRSRLRH